MNSIKNMEPFSRVIVLIDMDCFYCQVEEQFNPELVGKPIAVVQYNAWRGGGIIAVNYRARNYGVTRQMRGEEAKRMCPDIVLCSVNEYRERADLSKYRNAGKKVIDVLKGFGSILEKASVDEAYMDITDLVNKRIDEGLDGLTLSNMENTFVIGFENVNIFLTTAKENRDIQENNLKLAVGGLIMEEIRSKLYEETGFTSSAGIAHNKILAKLVCGLNKPNKQTILPHESVKEFFKFVPINKITNLGGKFGETVMQDFNIFYVSELAQIPFDELFRRYEQRNSDFLYNVARGTYTNPVKPHTVSYTVGISKQFNGIGTLKIFPQIEYWLYELATDIVTRLQEDAEENSRKAEQIVFTVTYDNINNDINISRTNKLHLYDIEAIAKMGLNIIKKNCKKPNGSYCIKQIGFSGTGFKPIAKMKEITSFFKIIDYTNIPTTSKRFPSLPSSPEPTTTEKKIIEEPSVCEEEIDKIKIDKDSASALDSIINKIESTHLNVKWEYDVKDNPNDNEVPPINNDNNEIDESLPNNENNETDLSVKPEKSTDSDINNNNDNNNNDDDDEDDDKEDEDYSYFYISDVDSDKNTVGEYDDVSSTTDTDELDSSDDYDHEAYLKRVFERCSVCSQLYKKADKYEHLKSNCNTEAGCSKQVQTATIYTTTDSGDHNEFEYHADNDDSNEKQMCSICNINVNDLSNHMKKEHVIDNKITLENDMPKDETGEDDEPFDGSIKNLQ